MSPHRALPLLALAAGCGFLDAPGDPVLMANKRSPRVQVSHVAEGLKGVGGIEVDVS